MKRTILSAIAALLAATILCADRSDALIGADIADRSIHRYTVVVGGTIAARFAVEPTRTMRSVAPLITWVRVSCSAASAFAGPSDRSAAICLQSP